NSPRVGGLKILADAPEGRMTQFSCSGERAVFDIEKQLRLEPGCLGLFDLLGQRLGTCFQSFSAFSDFPFRRFVKPILHFPGIEQFAILPAAEIKAVELTPIRCDPSDNERLPLPTGLFAPVGGAPRAVFGVLALLYQTF